MSRILRRVPCDLILSPGTEPIAYLETGKPIVCWADAPFAAMLNYYSWYCNLSPVSQREGMECDTRALKRCNMAIFSSEWAADASVSGHRVDPAKVHVLTFGPNLDIDFSEDQLKKLLPLRRRRPWRFLLVGVEWQRKGADIVFDVVGELNRRGYPSEMIVAGCRPPAAMGALPSYLRLEGFLDKRSENDRAKLRDLYKSALFLLHALARRGLRRCLLRSEWLWPAMPRTRHGRRSHTYRKRHKRSALCPEYLNRWLRRFHHFCDGELLSLR